MLAPVSVSMVIKLPAVPVKAKEVKVWVVPAVKRMALLGVVEVKL